MEIKAFVRILRNTRKFEGMYDQLQTFGKKRGLFSRRAEIIEYDVIHPAQIIEVDGKFGIFNNQDFYMSVAPIFDKIIDINMKNVWVGTYNNETYIFNNEGKIILKTKYDYVVRGEIEGYGYLCVFDSNQPDDDMHFEFYSLKGTFLGECFSLKMPRKLKNDILKIIKKEAEISYSLDDFLLEAFPEDDMVGFDIYGAYEDGEYYLITSLETKKEYLEYMQGIKNNEGSKLKLTKEN